MQHTDIVIVDIQIIKHLDGPFVPASLHCKAICICFYLIHLDLCQPRLSISPANLNWDYRKNNKLLHEKVGDFL